MQTPSTPKRKRENPTKNSTNKKTRTFTTDSAQIEDTPQTTNKTPKNSSITPLLNNLLCRSSITITRKNLTNDINNIPCKSCRKTDHSTKASSKCPEFGKINIQTCSACGQTGHSTKVSSKCSQNKNSTATNGLSFVILPIFRAHRRN